MVERVMTGFTLHVIQSCNVFYFYNTFYVFNNILLTCSNCNACNTFLHE